MPNLTSIAAEISLLFSQEPRFSRVCSVGLETNHLGRTTLFSRYMSEI